MVCVSFSICYSNLNYFFFCLHFRQRRIASLFDKTIQLDADEQAQQREQRQQTDLRMQQMVDNFDKDVYSDDQRL